MEIHHLDCGSVCTVEATCDGGPGEQWSGFSAHDPWQPVRRQGG